MQASHNTNRNTKQKSSRISYGNWRSTQSPFQMVGVNQSRPLIAIAIPHIL
uniref:Uncharacterized protein n=1 Tax=Arundo donax TaxID=35708 RepID=A0A0A9DAV2_ARUDO